MSAYRFCRTDDIGLLVDALNRCWAPSAPDDPPMTPAAFKRSIRDEQVWCSSCMVAFAGDSPVGVLIGAKRPSATLVRTIAVHADHRRQGHGRHLLASLGSKLAILGPPRIVAEVPEGNASACGLFRAGGYVEEAILTDYVLDWGDHRARAAAGLATCRERPPSGDPLGRTGEQFVIPVTVDDLAANGLLESSHPPASWDRSIETLTARKDEIAGLAVASDERLEACVLYLTPEPAVAEIVALRSVTEDDGARLNALLARLGTLGVRACRFAKVHPAEVSREALEACGFRPVGTHRLCAATARAG